MKKIILAYILFFTMLTFSYGQDLIIIRPNMAVGYFYADDNKGTAVNYGLNFLLSSNEFQRYGLIFDHLTMPDNKEISYLCTGIMVEQVLFNYFNMRIGTNWRMY